MRRAALCVLRRAALCAHSRPGRADARIFSAMPRTAAAVARYAYESLEAWLGELHREVMMAVYDDYRRVLPLAPSRDEATEFLLDMLTDVQCRIGAFFIRKLVRMLSRADVRVHVSFVERTIALTLGTNRDASVSTVSYDDREGVIGLMAGCEELETRDIGSERTFSYVDATVARYGFTMEGLGVV